MGNAKLLERARRTRHNWKLRQLDKLLGSFGFDKKEGGKHVVYAHSAGVYLTVSRQKEVDPCYVREAVKAIESVTKAGNR